MGDHNRLANRFCWACSERLYTTAAGIREHAEECDAKQAAEIVERIARLDEEGSVAA